jgi:hypothetical protein
LLAGKRSLLTILKLQIERPLYFAVKRISNHMTTVAVAPQRTLESLDDTILALFSLAQLGVIILGEVGRTSNQCGHDLTKLQTVLLLLPDGLNNVDHLVCLTEATTNSPR